MKYLILVSLLAFTSWSVADKPVKHKGKLTVSYDRFKDVTNTTMAVKLPTVQSGNRSLTMMAAHVYPGKTFQKPGKILLSFFAESRDWLFLDEWQRSCIVLTDTKRIQYGTLQRLGSQVELGGVVELAGVWISPAAFLEFASAKTAEIQLGNTTYRLKPEHLTAFREFAIAMQLLEGD
jgi:hypothetical protein